MGDRDESLQLGRQLKKVRERGRKRTNAREGEGSWLKQTFRYGRYGLGREEEKPQPNNFTGDYEQRKTIARLNFLTKGGRDPMGEAKLKRCKKEAKRGQTQSRPGMTCNVTRENAIV